MAKPTLASNRRRRRMFTLIWMAALAILTIFLIYYELTAVLYILATLGVTALLVVVALSDLGKDEKLKGDMSINDSAAIGSGISSSVASK